MSNWYAALIDRIRVSASGIIADNLRNTLKSCAFRKFEEGQGIDVSVSQEVQKWFNATFEEWFSILSTKLGFLEGGISLFNYSETINGIIQELSVARAYYSKQADVAMTTSLKNVALTKVMLIDEVVTSLVFSYEQALGAAGIDPVKTIEMTDAVNFEGSAPEVYRWKQNKVIVNHVKFEDMETSTGEQSQQCAERKRDHLPWVIAAAFGLIAWSSAVTKPKEK